MIPPLVSAHTLHEMNELIVGIDLGTTNSAIGVVDSGFPMLLADKDGKRIIPSAVWYGADGAVGKRNCLRKLTRETVISN